MSFFHFEGPPCLQHTNYVFYRAFSFKSSGESKVLALGDFFFLKILQGIHVCIGEIELLWEDKASNQLLASLRLYFRPEHTPDGRHDDSGEDEMVVLGEKLVLRLDDLVPLMKEDYKWPYGSTATNPNQGTKSPPLKEENGTDQGNNNNKMEAGRQLNGKSSLPTGAANVAVLSYPRYCRYRAMKRRLEGRENEWLHLAVVMAIGGISGRAPGCRVMFCRDSFYHADIDDLDIRMDHMMPTLKHIKNKVGKKAKQLIIRKDSQHDSDSMEEMFAHVAPSISTSSRPRRSTESGDLSEDRVNTEEQVFLIGLHNFMHDAKMPIGKIPSLGFKQIDLYVFYKQAEKLGGYDSITTKRMWKHLYDKMGGNSSNTSAATCTRRHYERLLLPYERHLRKIKAMKQKKRPHNFILGQPEVVLERHREPTRASQQENVVVDVKVEEEEPKKEVKIEVQENAVRIEDSSFKSAHSIPQDGQRDVEVLEIPLVTQRHSGLKDIDMNMPPDWKKADQQMALPTLSEGNNMKPSAIPVLPAEFGAMESTFLHNPNMAYQGGYLVPLHPQQLMQAKWGMMGQTKMDIPTTNGTKDPKSPLPLAAHSGKTNNPLLIKDSSLFPSPSQQAESGEKPQASKGRALKAAHVNAPYQSAPYLLVDHIQQQKAPSSSSSCTMAASHPFGSSSPHQLINDILTNPSQALTPLLHPVPPGHKTEHILPPAPNRLFLDPRNTDPLSPLPSLSYTLPPSAHCHPRKRQYPFDATTLPAPGMFPSPDMVLDRIKSSTALPRKKQPVEKQQFDSPFDIFKQTAQTFSSANQSSGSQNRKPSQAELSSSKRMVPKSKSSSSSQRKTQPQSLQLLGAMPGLAHSAQSVLSSQSSSNGNIAPPPHFSYSKIADPLKSISTSNGILFSDQHLASKGGVVSPVMVPSDAALGVGKDGCLTSALFGAQFTAMPRSTKQSELAAQPINSSEPPASSASSSSASAAAAAAAAAMSFNSHLHPAFMSAYLPPGVSSAAALSPQLQMLAGAYGTSPAQLAAYEEMLRQNPYGAFLAAGAPPPAKVGKKN